MLGSGYGWCTVVFTAIWELVAPAFQTNETKTSAPNTSLAESYVSRCTDKAAKEVSLAWMNQEWMPLSAAGMAERWWDMPS